jgi:hypothetical protein
MATMCLQPCPALLISILGRGYLAYAKLKDSDWGQANYRLHGAFHALHLNYLNTEILEMTQEIMQLSAEADRSDPKDVPEELNKKINQLMEASRAKLLAYGKHILRGHVDSIPIFATESNNLTS